MTGRMDSRRQMAGDSAARTSAYGPFASLTAVQTNVGFWGDERKLCGRSPGISSTRGQLSEVVEAQHHQQVGAIIADDERVAHP